MTDIYLHAAAVCLAVAGFLVCLVAGFVCAAVALGALAVIHARAESSAPAGRR